jgi:membrane protease YdiL (CAAX protease family)
MDTTHEGDKRNFVAMAVLFEAGLGATAIALGWWTGPLPWETISTGTTRQLWMGAAAGVLAALASFAFVVWADRRPLRVFEQLQRTIRQLVVPLFRGVSTHGLAAISLAAGVGEELLFRGYAQAALAQWLAPPWGSLLALCLASLLFGLCHWVSSAYAIVATGMGLLLGGLFLVTGNLIAPVVAHALYDFLVLYYLCRDDRS